jgi:hypothetical protein
MTDRRRRIRSRDHLQSQSYLLKSITLPRILIPPYRRLAEMISTGKSLPFLAFIALVSLVVITLNLTSSVNVAAAVAPARQFLLLSLVDGEELC